MTADGQGPEQPHDADGHPVERAPKLAVTTRSVEGAAVVEVSGDLDAATAPLLGPELLDVIDAAGGSCVVVDLTGVGFLGSAGLRVLAEADEAAADLRVVASGTAARRSLDVSRLDTVLRVHPSLAAALGQRAS